MRDATVIRLQERVQHIDAMVNHNTRLIAQHLELVDSRIRVYETAFLYGNVFSRLWSLILAVVAPEWFRTRLDAMHSRMLTAAREERIRQAEEAPRKNGQIQVITPERPGGGVILP